MTLKQVQTTQVLTMGSTGEATDQRGKFHCTADLLFDWFGFDQTSKAVANSTKARQLNPNKI